MNQNLIKAKMKKNDEFYTQLSDIENEMKHYKEHFRGKIVYCNCDNPKESNFVKYFKDNFKELGLKKLNISYLKENGDGDFRSDECIELLKESDIIVTNPPFSLFREYVAQLMEYEKKFLIIGNMNSATNCKEIFLMVLENKIWLGNSSPKQFKEPNGNFKKFGNINWYTNLEHKKRNEELILYKEYNEKESPKYDNYDVINIDKVKEIPFNYHGIMGVPITFLQNYNPNQFKILGMCNSDYFRGSVECLARINGIKKYARLLIKKVENINL